MPTETDTDRLIAVAGLVSALGIRNAQCDPSRIAPESIARCHDRATPPPAPAAP